MSTHTTHARRSHSSAPRRSRAVGSPIPRRVSGPVPRPATAGAAALPARGLPARRQSTGAFERIARLPDHRLLDRLLRGRIWIWLIGLSLGGIVAMQVSMLTLNTGISRAVQSSATVEHQNAALEASIARLSSQERIQRAAGALGMAAPEAGDVIHLRARPHVDGRRAAVRMSEPSDQARQLLAAGTGASGAGATGTGTTETATVQAGTVTTTAQAEVPTAPAGTTAATTAPTTGTATAPVTPAPEATVPVTVQATPVAGSPTSAAPQG